MDMTAHSNTDTDTGALARLRADGGTAELVVRALTAIYATVPSRASLRRGVASERSKTAPPPPRASQNLWWRTHDSGAATICVRTGALLGL